jgi:alpha-aminoadipic semialdehyde synthase
MNFRLGVRREDLPHERRAPLCPDDLLWLSRKGISVAVEPSSARIFADREYLDAGAALEVDLSPCGVILGLKEVAGEKLMAKKCYLFFSHTMKGQDHNLPMLKRLLELGCTLIDYEAITDRNGRRLVYFGHYAGYAGMIDSLWALGQRLARVDQLDTPLLALQQTLAYDDIDHAERMVRAVGLALKEMALPADLTPITIGLAGMGNVSKGAQQVMHWLGATRIAAEDLATAAAATVGIRYVVFDLPHLVQRRTDGGFSSREHYYAHPEEYEPIFAQRYLPELNLLANCIYWEARFPRLVTLADLQALYRNARGTRLRVIGDLSCDVGGAIEATVKTTEPVNPVYVYDLDRAQAIDGVHGRGPVILAIYNLPSELPREASAAFSCALSPFLPRLAAAQLDASLERSGLPQPLQRATIAYRGELTPRFAYLQPLL